MSYKIEQYITRVNKGRAGRNRPQWLVVHFVGASGQAWDNARYFRSEYRGSSAHYFLDPKSIVQVVPDNTPAWHVGDGSRTRRGQFNGYVGYGTTNENSIGLELCQDITTGSNVWEWDFHPETERKALWLIKELQRKYNIPNERVIRHHDASGKMCPGNWSHNNWVKWYDFKKRVAGEKAVEGKLVQKPKVEVNIEELARGTIAGKYGNGEERKKRLGNNYGEVMKRVNEILTGKSKPVKKSVSVIAKEVIDGKWGNNPQRSSRLKEAGYNPDTVQSEVNRQLGAKSKPVKKSVSVIAKEVIDGKWGNNPQRSSRLKGAGYNPDTVQSEVNRQLGVKSKPAKKVITKKLIDDVIAGNYGNGKDRENRLRRLGYNPADVQREVNKRF